MSDFIFFIFLTDRFTFTFPPSPPTLPTTMASTTEQAHAAPTLDEHQQQLDEQVIEREPVSFLPSAQANPAQ
jgi:hypothetical protein